VAWTGAALAGGLTEAIGLAAAFFPGAWLSLFGSDATMNDVGTHYLHIVGPFYGFFGFGLALYFASQGAGRLGWPLRAAVLRMAIATGGGWLALQMGGLTGLFWALGLALAAFGLVTAIAVACGAWFDRVESCTPPRSGVPQPS
jgi:Na+-driven multidrug efflux pump